MTHLLARSYALTRALYIRRESSKLGRKKSHVTKRFSPGIGTRAGTHRRLFLGVSLCRRCIERYELYSCSNHSSKLIRQVWAFKMTGVGCNVYSDHNEILSLRGCLYDSESGVLLPQKPECSVPVKILLFQ